MFWAHKNLTQKATDTVPISGAYYKIVGLGPQETMHEKLKPVSIIYVHKNTDIRHENLSCTQIMKIRPLCKITYYPMQRFHYNFNI